MRRKQKLWINIDRTEDLEETKGVIRIRKSKKDRQLNRQNKKNKWTKNDLQHNTHETKDRETKKMQNKNKQMLKMQLNNDKRHEHCHKPQENVVPNVAHAVLFYHLPFLWKLVIHHIYIIYVFRFSVLLVKLIKDTSIV